LRAEWAALGAGKALGKYWPLSHIESWIPAFYGALYVSGYIALMIAGIH
jgi:hypothetical protein